jgi:hypothetical protein
MFTLTGSHCKLRPNTEGHCNDYWTEIDKCGMGACPNPTDPTNTGDDISMVYGTRFWRRFWRRFGDDFAVEDVTYFLSVLSAVWRCMHVTQCHASWMSYTLTNATFNRFMASHR